VQFQGTSSLIHPIYFPPTRIFTHSCTHLVHDFFKPQPITSAAVFLLRVVLHDWPDAYAQRILLRLREAAAPGTRLVLADFVLPLACVDDFGMREGKGASGEGGGTVGGGADGNGIDGGGGNMREGGAGEGTLVEGAEKMLAPAPLLANLGKASANVYWMDLTVRSFHSCPSLLEADGMCRCK
jgi:hypothetical protein